MIEKHLVNVHLNSGTTLGTIFEAEPELEDAEVEATLQAAWQASLTERELMPLGGLILHPSAISAIELV